MRTTDSDLSLSASNLIVECDQAWRRRSPAVCGSENNIKPAIRLGL